MVAAGATLEIVFGATPILLLLFATKTIGGVTILVGVGLGTTGITGDGDDVGMTGGKVGLTLASFDLLFAWEFTAKMKMMHSCQMFIWNCNCL